MRNNIFANALRLLYNKRLAKALSRRDSRSYHTNYTVTSYKINPAGSKIASLLACYCNSTALSSSSSSSFSVLPVSSSSPPSSMSSMNCFNVVAAPGTARLFAKNSCSSDALKLLNKERNKQIKRTGKSH